MRVAPIFPHTQRALQASSQTRIEAAGVVLFRRNDPSFGIFLIQSGSVSLRIDGAGTTVLLDRMAGPGSIVGLPATLSGSCYSLTAMTLESCQLAFVERETLLKAVRKNADLGMELLQAMSEEVIAMREVLAAAPRDGKPNRGH